MNSSPSVVTSRESLWVWTSSPEHPVASALSSITSLRPIANNCPVHSATSFFFVHVVFFFSKIRYYNRNEAEDAIRFINGTRLDDRIIRCDWDAGFIEGRQYGRGKTGGQVNIQCNPF